MSLIRIVVLLATVLAIQGCSNDSHHRVPEPTEAVYPAAIKSLTSSYYQPDGSVFGNKNINIEYDENGKIEQRQFEQIWGEDIISSETTQYNSKGDISLQTARIDSDFDMVLDRSCATYFSYNIVNDLIEKLHTHTPDDPTLVQEAFKHSYNYDSEGQEILDRYETSEDDVIIDGKSYTKTSSYNSSGKISQTVYENLESTETRTFIYAETGMLSSSQRVKVGVKPFRTTRDFLYDENDLISHATEIFDENNDGQIESEHLSNYTYTQTARPFVNKHIDIEYDAEGTIETHKQSIIRYSYDTQQRVTSVKYEATDLLEPDQTGISEDWQFGYSINGKMATVEVWVDSEGDGNVMLMLSGELSMTASNTLSQLYHEKLDENVYHGLPLPLAIAKGYFFED